MVVRWFRITFARNAFLRLLSERGLVLDELTVAEGIRAMVDFAEAHKPQHAERDVTETSARAFEGNYELTLVRRMQRHDHPEVSLALTITFDVSGSVLSRSLVQS